MQKHFFAILFVILFSILCLSVFSIATESANSTNNPTGYAIVKVLEENSQKPIENATVCIVETRCYYQTDKHGYTQKIAIPIVSNKNFDISLKRDYGEFTIIAYAPGYSTMVCYYNQVFAGTTNAGTICKLPPIINPSDPEIISFAHKPYDDYTKTLVSLYKK